MRNGDAGGDFRRVRADQRRPLGSTDDGPIVTEAERINALLDLVDGNRTQDVQNSAQLVVLGLAERFGKAGRLRPTNAGWNVMGQRGRQFRAEYG